MLRIDVSKPRLRLPKGVNPTPWGFSGLEGEQEKAFASRIYKSFGRRQRAEAAFYKGTRWAFNGFALTLPFVGLSMASAQRGEVLTEGVTAVTSAVAFPFIQGAAAAALSLIPGMGGAYLMWSSVFLSMYPASRLDEMLRRGLRTFSRSGQQLRRLESGVGYEESTSSTDLRLQATRELSSATMTSRRWLGQEARYLHR